MNAFTETILAAILLTDIVMAGSSRMLRCIRVIAVQGFLIGLLPLAVTEWNGGSVHAKAIAISAINIVVKSIVLPYLLARVMRRVDAKRELEPFVGYTASIATMLALIILSFLVCASFDISYGTISNLAIPTAFSTISAGLFMIIARRKAITQVIGFLMFENGIAVFGTGIMLEYGLFVEIGILLDVFVLVFIMGIAIFHISREFSHIDASRLNRLGDSLPEDR